MRRPLSCFVRYETERAAAIRDTGQPAPGLTVVIRDAMSLGQTAGSGWRCYEVTKCYA
jgi:hypothetical protein